MKSITNKQRRAFDLQLRTKWRTKSWVRRTLRFKKLLTTAFDPQLRPKFETVPESIEFTQSVKSWKRERNHLLTTFILFLGITTAVIWYTESSIWLEMFIAIPVAIFVLAKYQTATTRQTVKLNQDGIEIGPFRKRWNKIMDVGLFEEPSEDHERQFLRFYNARGMMERVDLHVHDELDLKQFMWCCRVYLDKYGT